jgi:antibiotic biosynthesis monooxygenase (ABM) superfamily enzyme
MIENIESRKQKVVVLFEVTPTAEGKERYLELASQLKPLLSNAKGFIRSERFSSLNAESKLLSLNGKVKKPLKNGVMNLTIA